MGRVCGAGGIIFLLFNPHSTPQYNLLWQKLLKFDGPFPLTDIATDEVAYYISKSNAYGTPLDLR